MVKPPNEPRGSSPVEGGSRPRQKKKHNGELVWGDPFKQKGSTIPGSSRYVKCLPFGSFFWVKRHKFYTLGRSRYRSFWYCFCWVFFWLESRWWYQKTAWKRVAKWDPSTCKEAPITPLITPIKTHFFSAMKMGGVPGYLHVTPNSALPGQSPCGPCKWPWVPPTPCFSHSQGLRLGSVANVAKGFSPIGWLVSDGGKRYLHPL